MTRSHDKLYLQENNKEIKQSFMEVGDEIAKDKFNSIADVGCAAGAFPFYLSERFENSSITGIEYADFLLKKASNDFPSIDFIHGDVLQRDSVSKKFDVITMLGVLCIFDEYRKVIENVLSWLNPNGRIILHNMISDYDIDVYVKYSKSSLDTNLEKLEAGWNIVSLNSLRLIAESNNCKIITVKDFIINVDLPKRLDVMRSWTEVNGIGKREIFNALHIRQPQKIVVIQKVN